MEQTDEPTGRAMQLYRIITAVGAEAAEEFAEAVIEAVMKTSKR